MLKEKAINESNLYSLLDIEDTEEILDFLIDDYNFLLWPYIRYRLFSYLLNSIRTLKIGQSICNESLLKQRYSNLKKFFSFLPGLLTPWPNRDIWYLSNIGAHFYKYLDGKYIDIYNDTFASITPEKSLYIGQSLLATNKIRKHCYSYRCIQPAELAFGKTAKYFVRTKDQKIIKELLHFLKKRCRETCGLEVPEEIWKQFEDKLTYTIGYSIAKYKFFHAFFRYRKPKILVLTDNYYGNLGFTRQARDHGITTVEIQHGAIYPTHLAYNWAKKLCASQKLREHTVDYFLTFGSFWHNRLQLPGKYQEIGSPWFSIQQQRYKQGGDIILFCLAGYYDIFKNIIKDIVTSYPHKKVMVRPHPREKALFLKSGIAKLPRVIIDTNLDIYETFSKTEVVIGLASTSLFEALALGKRVYVMNTESTKDFFSGFQVSYFSNTDELLGLIDDPSTGRVSLEMQQSLFNTNWKENYKNFLDKILTQKR